MNREEIHSYLKQNLNCYSGVIEDYRAEKNEQNNKVFDVRWQGDVHFIVLCFTWGQGYYMERDHQRISSYYHLKKFDDKAIIWMQRLIGDIENGRYSRKKTLKEEIRAAVEARGLTGYMNKTKWKELFDDLSKYPSIPIMYKTIFEEEQPSGYWTLHGDEYIEHMNWAVIEWLKINPLDKDIKYRGQLIASTITEQHWNREIETILQKYHINYEYNEDERVYIIYGWK